MRECINHGFTLGCDISTKLSYGALQRKKHLGLLLHEVLRSGWDNIECYRIYRDNGEEHGN